MPWTTNLDKPRPHSPWKKKKPTLLERNHHFRQHSLPTFLHHVLLISVYIKNTFPLIHRSQFRALTRRLNFKSARSFSLLSIEASAQFRQRGRERETEKVSFSLFKKFHPPWTLTTVVIFTKRSTHKIREHARTILTHRANNETYSWIYIRRGDAPVLWRPMPCIRLFYSPTIS